jgi:hypothetical protein
MGLDPFQFTQIAIESAFLQPPDRSALLDRLATTIPEEDK